jgi:hypothetical protein
LSGVATVYGTAVTNRAVTGIRGVHGRSIRGVKLDGGNVGRGLGVEKTAINDNDGQIGQGAVCRGNNGIIDCDVRGLPSLWS